MGLGSDPSAWSGVVEMLREQFEHGGQARSIEDSVIFTSLNAITGAHRTSILALFRALALAPEDAFVPLEVLRLMYNAAQPTTDKIPPPSLLNIRRWLKVLQGLSLVLGTIDRPSLHVSTRCAHELTSQVLLTIDVAAGCCS